MSQMGHSRHFGRRPATSSLPPEADIATAGRHIAKEPEATSEGLAWDCRWPYLERSHSTMPRVKAPGWLAVPGLAVVAGAGMLSIKSLSPSMRKMRV